MIVSMVAPSSLYVFSQRKAYLDWKTKLKFLPALVVLGMGLAVNNTRGVLEALFGHSHGEFVRTPKLGEMAEGSKTGAGQARASAPAGYRIPLSGMFLVETFMGLWACGAFVEYLITYKFLVGPILLLHALGFLTVGITSVRHDIRAKHHQDELARQAR